MLEICIAETDGFFLEEKQWFAWQLEYWVFRFSTMDKDIAVKRIL